MFSAASRSSSGRLSDDPPSPEAQALITRAGQRVDTFFHFYGSGKSAVSLAARGMLPPERPHDLRGERESCGVEPGTFILHYACCGFAAFWPKYVTLGRFSDKWWGKIDIADAVGPFHCRHVMRSWTPSHRRCRACTSLLPRPVDDCRFMLIAEMARYNLLQRIDEPAKILARLR